MWFSFETSSLALGEALDWGPGAWSWGGHSKLTSCDLASSSREPPRRPSPGAQPKSVLLSPGSRQRKQALHFPSKYLSNLLVS